MKIPVVLSTVHVTIDVDGVLEVDLDGARYADDRTLRRGDLRSVVDEITKDLGSAVRVELHEADGTTYTDIHTPPELPASAHWESEPETAPPALAGAGFQPGEEVALAYVVARQSADIDGKASINLPPATVAAARSGLVLLGLSSLTVAPIETSA
jgi:hypothetical protein